MKNKKVILLLNIAFFIYSLSSVMSKLAAGKEPFSLVWILLYGGVLMVLMIYAVLWQIALGKTDLITAYSNKAVVVIWGLLWGAVLFGEHLSFPKIAGVLVIIAGILTISRGEKND